MDDVKKVYRAAKNKVKKAGRELDGHDAGDDVANLGDEIDTKIANAGDDVRRGARKVKREIENP